MGFLILEVKLKKKRLIQLTKETEVPLKAKNKLKLTCFSGIKFFFLLNIGFTFCKTVIPRNSICLA